LDKEHGTTDWRYFPKETTVLLYQPTDNNIHTAGEYTTINQLEDVYTIYERFIKQTPIY
jgi:acetylornithine deacetylase/succinyl-diaminopimelate desuccinylase-like protein